MPGSEAEPPQGVSSKAPCSEHAARQGATLLIAVLLGGFALQWAQVVILPIVLAVLVSYALDPAHRRIVAMGMPRHVSAAVVTIVMIVILAMMAGRLRGQAVAFVNKLPTAAQKVRELVTNGGTAGAAVVTLQQAALELRQAADPSAPARDRDVMRVLVEQPFLGGDLLWRGSLGAIALAGQAMVILFLVYYLLAGGDRYRRKIIRVAGPSLARRRLTLEILNQISGQIERFLVARLIISILVGVVTGVAFWIIGVSQPAIWGLGAGVLNTIPYLGPAVIAAAAAIMGLVQFHTVGMASLVAGTSVVIASLEGLLITPWLLGRAGRMNAGAVFIGLTFWGWIWGICGLLLAVPILIVIKAICDHVEGGSSISELLGE
jgi:predicted PurR-regulated permease PerM